MASVALKATNPALENVNHLNDTPDKATGSSTESPTSTSTSTSPENKNSSTMGTTSTNVVLPTVSNINPQDAVSTTTTSVTTVITGPPSKISTVPPALTPLSTLPIALPTVMTAMQMTSFTGRSRMTLQSGAALPPVYDHDVLIKVYNASINPIDWKLFNGDIPVYSKKHLPLTLGYDVAGVIVRVGNLVTKFRVGDSVFARCDRVGAFAEYCATGESSVALKPNSISFKEAATAPLAALTAYQCLVDVARIAPGQKVLIHAGSGGVGLFAIQIAKILGCFVATTCSSRNFELLKALGADIVINYRTQRFQDYINDYDVVLDSVAGSNITNSISCLKAGGILVEIGGVPSTKVLRSIGLRPYQSPSILSMFASSKFAKRGYEAQAEKRHARYVYYFMHPDGAQLAQIGSWLESKRLKTIIDRSYPLAKLEEAFNYSATGHASGKISIEIANPEQGREVLI